MTLLEILTDIGSRVGDVNLDRYKDRAKRHLVTAVSKLFEDENLSQEEIPGYVFLKSDLSFSTGPSNIQSLQVFKVRSIHIPPDQSSTITVTYLNREEVKNMAGIESLQPTVNDLFIYRVGNTLYTVVADGTQVDLTTQLFHLWYIKGFTLEGVDDTDEF